MMDLRTLAALPLSAQRGWPELLQARPGRWSLLLQLVLPVSLVPPAVLYMALTSPQCRLPVDGAHTRLFALVVLAAEFISVAVGSRMLRWVAGTYGLSVAAADALLLAALAPLPLWMSTAAAALPGIAAAVAVGFLGLVLACGTVFHGLVAICRPQEEFAAAGIVQVVASAGVAAWGLLLALLLALA